MAVVTMSAIWDRTQAVATQRIGALAAVALLCVWLPGLIQLATRLALIGPGPASATSVGPAALLALLGLVTSLVALVGSLALVAIGVDPGTRVGAAVRVGVRRLLPMLGLALLVGLALFVAALPILAVVPGLATMQAGSTPDLPPAASAFVRWYSVAVLVALLWVEARVVLLLSPVVVEERRGLGAFLRSLHLTRGLTWRIVGAILLFALVAGVAVLAARSVAGVAAWVVLGGAHPRLVQFAASATASLVATGFAAIAAVFAAQLYVALAGGTVRVAPSRVAGPAGPVAAPAAVKAGPWG